MRELLEYAGRSGICLGLENRYHYFDIPSQDELALLLELAGPERIGFIYDVGHATAHGPAGFLSRREWLERFGDRIVGTHLHDVIGFTDHHAPGLGEVDFRMPRALTFRRRPSAPSRCSAPIRPSSCGPV